MRTWRESVAAALMRQAGKQHTGIVTRQQLIEGELPRIVRETGSRGATPEQTLSRVLQDLRDDKQIEFKGPGEYRLLSTLVR
jgi:putative restriction endonuclease